MNSVAVVELLRSMSRANIRYLLLRPFNQDSTDVDVLLDPSDLEKVVALAHAQKLTLLWTQRKFYHCLMAFSDSNHQLVFFDFQFQQLYERMRHLPRKQLLKKSMEDENGIRIPLPVFQALGLLCHCTLDKRRFQENHLSVLRPLMAKYRNEIQSHAGGLWRGLEESWSHRDETIPNLSRNRVRWRLFLLHPFNFFFFINGGWIVWFDRLRWWIKRPGISLALIGTDGTGKSTQAKAIFDFLNEQKIPVVRFYRSRSCHPDNAAGVAAQATKKLNGIRPAVTPTIKSSIKSIPFVGKLLQDLNALWIALYWTASFKLRVSAHLHRGRWVIIDRHVFDLITLPRRVTQSAWFEKLLRRIAFRADCMVYLFADPKLIVGRKSDNSIEETTRQLAAYSRIQDCMTHLVDVSEEKELVSKKILRAMYAACRERLRNP